MTLYQSMQVYQGDNYPDKHIKMEQTDKMQKNKLYHDQVKSETQYQFLPSKIPRRCGWVYMQPVGAKKAILQ